MMEAVTLCWDDPEIVMIVVTFLAVIAMFYSQCGFYCTLYFSEFTGDVAFDSDLSHD